MFSRASVVAVIACLALVGCGGDSPEPEPIALDEGCPVSADTASNVLGADVNETTPDSIPGMPTPRLRCQYSGEDASLQVSVFDGDEVLQQLGVVEDGPDAVELLGTRSACGTSSGSETGGASCVFENGDQTYVVALSTSDTSMKDISQKVQALSIRLVSASAAEVRAEETQ